MTESARSQTGATDELEASESQPLHPGPLGWLDPSLDHLALADLAEKAHRILQDPTAPPFDRASAQAYLNQLQEAAAMETTNATGGNADTALEAPVDTADQVAGVDTAATSPRPTTGRIVHYHDGTFGHLLALVNVGETGDELERIGLVVVPAAPSGAIPELRQVYVSATPGTEAGSWHWPER